MVLVPAREKISLSSEIRLLQSENASPNILNHHMKFELKYRLPAILIFMLGFIRALRLHQNPPALLAIKVAYQINPGYRCLH